MVCSDACAGNALPKPGVDALLAPFSCACCPNREPLEPFCCGCCPKMLLPPMPVPLPFWLVGCDALLKPPKLVPGVVVPFCCDGWLWPKPLKLVVVLCCEGWLNMEFEPPKPFCCGCVAVAPKPPKAGADDCEKEGFMPFCCGGFAGAGAVWPNWNEPPFVCGALKLKDCDENGFVDVWPKPFCGCTAGLSLRPRSVRAFGFSSLLSGSRSAIWNQRKCNHNEKEVSPLSKIVGSSDPIGSRTAQFLSIGREGGDSL